MLDVYVDGAARNNNDPTKENICAVAYHIKGTGNIVYGVQLKQPATNNETEYWAVMFALQDLDGDLRIHSDSKLTIMQLTDQWQTKQRNLRELRPLVDTLMAGRKVEFVWCPRDTLGIQLCDRRANEILDAEEMRNGNDSN